MCCLLLIHGCFIVAMTLTVWLSSDSFEGVTEVVLLESLTQLDASAPVDFNGFLPKYLPRPPNAFRGIRKKTSSFKRWLIICSDESVSWVLLHDHLWYKCMLYYNSSLILCSDLVCQGWKIPSCYQCLATLPRGLLNCLVSSCHWRLWFWWYLCEGNWGDILPMVYHFISM